MTVKEKAALIAAIIAQTRFYAKAEKKPFSDGDMFLTLAFRTDDELNEIARLIKI